jgi:hypothetical protein
MSKRSRILAFGSAAVFVIAGGICAAVVGDGLGEALALGLIGIGLVEATSLVFLEVGLSEDRERDRERQQDRDRRSRAKLPPSAERLGRPRPGKVRLGRMRGRHRRLP